MRERPAGRERPPARIILAVILITLLAAVTIVGALTVFQLPDSVTEQGDDVTVLYQVVLAISFLIFFLVTAGIIWAVFRYKRTGPEIPEQIHGSSVLEMAWTVVPVIILVALFIPALLLVVNLKTPPPEDEVDVTVEAVGHQWWWEFVYPNEGIRIQQTPPDYENLDPPVLVVPVDREILINVRSTDVVHSFAAPNTLYKIQAIPGNVNQMHMTITQPGTYAGQCYQFCGLRHSDMLFILDAREPAAYEQWLRETQAAQGMRGTDQARSGGEN
jgi:cytochrome c oxidase subunit II